MKIRIVKSYRSAYPDPLILYPGDEVLLIKEEKEEKWHGWVYCEFKGCKGWIPKSIIRIKDNVKGIITEYYSAKELDVNEGEILDHIKTLNGWMMLRNDEDETGWVPEENTNLFSS